MSIQPEVRPQPSRGSSGTDDEAPFHYVDKSKVAESAVLGTPVTALCGATFAVTREPKPGAPICPACKAIKESGVSLS